MYNIKPVVDSTVLCTYKLIMRVDPILSVLTPPTHTQAQRGTKKLFGGDGYVYYLDCGDGSMRMHVHMSKFIKLCTLDMCSFLYLISQ